MKGNLAVRLGVAFTGILIACAPLVVAQDGGAGPGFGEHKPPFERAMGPMGDHGRWWNNPKVVDKLKLTDDQRKAMDSTYMEHRESLIDLHASLQKAELEMEPLMSQDQPNESQILAQIDKVASARAELEKANARFLLAIRGKLTADQWKQLQADRASHQRGDWGKGPGPAGERHHLPPPPPGGPGPQSMLTEPIPPGAH
jgi:Spy/CpxP family protein refolding chaperone